MQPIPLIEGGGVINQAPTAPGTTAASKPLPGIRSRPSDPLERIPGRTRLRSNRRSRPARLPVTAAMSLNGGSVDRPRRRQCRR
jgi:hypothetical protein